MIFSGRRLARLASTATAASLLAILASCSMTSDPDTLFGLSPTAMTAQEEASAETAALAAAQGADVAEAETVAAAATPAPPSPLRFLQGGTEAPAPQAPEAAAPSNPPAADDAADAAAVPAAEKRSFLAGLFSQDDEAAPAAPQAAAASRPLVARPAPSQQAEPLLNLASIDPRQAIEPARPRAANGDLPGVRSFDSLFEISRADGLVDNSDVDVHETAGSYQVASLAPGMGRLAPNGLRTQTSGVDVNCLNPSLVRTLKGLESHFRSQVIVTSGYRSPEHNRRVRGAQNSFHMRCAAADIQVVGVDKMRLANYLRALPGRGGVGTYCHTHSVHVDTGPRRDWNWRCRS